MNALFEAIPDSFKKIIGNGEEVSFPTFNNIKDEIYEIKLCSKGRQFSYTINTNEDWIYFA